MSHCACLSLSYVLPLSLKIQCVSFLADARSRRSGRAEEEADLPQVHVPRSGPGSTAGHELRAAYASAQCTRQKTVFQRYGLYHTARHVFIMHVCVRFEAQATGVDQEASQGEEGGASNGEASCGEDAPQEHDSRARDDRQCGGDPQWPDVQPGGDKGSFKPCSCVCIACFFSTARDGWLLLGRVLHHLQASEAWPTRHWGNTLLKIHSPEIDHTHAHAQAVVT